MKSFIRWLGHALKYATEEGGRTQLPIPALRTDHMALRVSGLCFLVLFLEGYDVSAMGYATPSLIEAWHSSAPQFTAMVTLGAEARGHSLRCRANPECRLAKVFSGIPGAVRA